MYNFPLLSASLNVEKIFSDAMVDKAVNDTFGSETGPNISRSLSTRSRVIVPDNQIKNSIERLGVLLSNSKPDCKECETMVLEMKTLLKSKNEENLKIRNLLKEALDDISPSRSRNVNNLLKEIREQSDKIHHLESQMGDIHRLQVKISDKEAELLGMNELVAKKDETISSIELLVETRDIELEQLRETLKNTQTTFESFKKSHDKDTELSRKLQQNLKELQEKELLILEIDNDKKVLDDRVKSLGEELNRVKSRGPTLQEISDLKEEGSRLLQEVEDKSKTITTMESTIKFLNDKLYDTTKRLNSSDLSNKKCEADKQTLQDMNQSLVESRDECLSSTAIHETEMNQLLEKNEVQANEISGLKQIISKAETITRATEYITLDPRFRKPTEKRLLGMYATRFLIQKVRGSGSYSPMTFDPSSGIINKSDLKIFSDMAFNDNPGKIEIIVKDDQGRPTPLSTKTNNAFLTWKSVRGSNTCRFLTSGNSNDHSVRQKEFLLLLYIIHIEGLYGNNGEPLISPGEK